MAQTESESALAENKGRGAGRPFSPGVSGNPGGRPKHSAFSRAMRDLLEHTGGGLPEGWDGKKLTGAQDLAMRTLAQAQSGSPQHLTVVLDRAEGKAPMADEDREAIKPTGEGADALRAVLDMLEKTN